MFYRKKLSKVLCVLAPIFLVSSCTTLKLDPPGPDKQAILVLPVQVTHKAQIKRHGFYYIYEIVKAGSSNTVYRAIFKLPIRGDMLIVDTLPPGDYLVDKFIYKTVGSGDFTYGRNVQPRNDDFRLEAGKITIFSKSLDVLIYNRIPGRGMETSYQFNMVPVSSVQREEILATLKELDNSDMWTFPGSGP